MATGSVSAPTELTCTCPAKVNLALSVGPPDARGYHPIASWMVAVDFGDTLTLRRLDAGPSTFDIAYANDAPRPAPIDWPLEKDLAVRAHALLEAEVGGPLPVHATLRKRIPTGAGLGGGSSDAAAMLTSLARLFGLDVDRATQLRLASRLGSDIAFLVHVMHGEPSASVGGFGERIEPRPLASPLHVVLVFPPLHCPTAHVYRAYDELTERRAALRDADVQGLTSARPLDPGLLFNDLAEPAFRVAPALRDIRNRVATTADRPVHVTGSGAALFCVTESDSHATELARAIQRETAIPTVATRTL